MTQSKHIAVKLLNKQTGQINKIIEPTPTLNILGTVGTSTVELNGR